MIRLLSSIFLGFFCSFIMFVVLKAFGVNVALAFVIFLFAIHVVYRLKTGHWMS